MAVRACQRAPGRRHRRRCRWRTGGRDAVRRHCGGRPASRGGSGVAGRAAADGRGAGSCGGVCSAGSTVRTAGAAEEALPVPCQSARRGRPAGRPHRQRAEPLRRSEPAAGRHLYAWSEQTGRLRFFTSNNLALSADGFAALGGFDPRFPARRRRGPRPPGPAGRPSSARSCRCARPWSATPTRWTSRPPGASTPATAPARPCSVRRRPTARRAASESSRPPSTPQCSSGPFGFLGSHLCADARRRPRRPGPRPHPHRPTGRPTPSTCSSATASAWGQVRRHRPGAHVRTGRPGAAPRRPSRPDRRPAVEDQGAQDRSTATRHALDLANERAPGSGPPSTSQTYGDPQVHP
jgi:hypothetical protein